MKKFIFRIILFFPFLSFAQNPINYSHHYSKNTIDAHESYFPLKIEYDFEFSELSQDHWTVFDIRSKNAWKPFFDYTFGHKMNPIDVLYLKKVANGIDEFIKKYKYPPYKVVSLLLSITNSLSAIKHPDYNPELLYFPYELIMTGVHKPLDRQSFLAGMLSLFCFDTTFVLTNSGFLISVLTEKSGDLTLRNNEYLVLDNGFKVKLNEIHSIQEQCIYNSHHQDPIEPHLKHVLQEYDYIGDQQFEVTAAHSSIRQYSARVKIQPTYSIQNLAIQNNSKRIEKNRAIKGYWIQDTGNRLEAVGNIYK